MRSQAVDKEELDNADMAHEEEVRLVQRVFLAKRRKPSRLVVFCAVERGNGCSRVCARAGEVLAAKVKGTVCVVDANLRSPSLHRYFELDNRRGFTEAMLECGSWRLYAHQLMDSNLYVVTSGEVPTDPHSLLTSENVQLRIKELQGAFDYVLLDTSAASRYTDAGLLGSASDGVVLVMEANRTRRETAKKVKDDLIASKSRILAAVLNKRTFPIPEAIYRIL
jgi:capsular exopolysaccharide synthesis family protein